MKKYFAMLLMALLLLGGGALAEGNSDVEELTFEMFYTEYGLPYEGEWICLDDAVYFYAPMELPQAEITDEMREDGVLAYYLDTDEQGNTLLIQISRQNENASVEAIAEEFRIFCTDVEIVEINGMSAVDGLCISESERRMEAYVEAIAANGVSYRFEMNITAEEEISDISLAMHALGMMSSFSETPLEIDQSKVNTQNEWMEGDQEAMSASMSSVVTLQFTFNERAAEDLEQINRMLAVMDLTGVTVEDFEGYLATTRKMEDGAAVETTYRYGFDSCTLVCEKAEFGRTRRYQIMTEVFAGANAMENGQYEAYWRATYPDRRMTTLVEVTFDEQTAYVVVYSEEDAEQMKT